MSLILPEGREKLSVAECIGGNPMSITNSSSPYSVANKDDLNVDASLGATIVNLPSAVNYGLICIEKTDASANPVTIEGANVPSIVLNTQNQVKVFRSNGSIWKES